jgi:succinate-semialdehyde dehydrogenase/glutarate-semialdehyde dehydrogenase
VLQVITGDAIQIASTLMNSFEVRKLSFTGSTEVGKILIRQSADTVKKLTLELGGNAPFIVFEDADIEKAVQGALFAKYRNSGQTCICVNRFLIHKKIAEQFSDRLVAESRKLAVGNGYEEKVDLGPLISLDAKQKVLRLVQEALRDNACCMLDGTKEHTGQFLGPTVLSGVTPHMSIWREEIFGPVSTITHFESEDELLSLAHQTQAGLAAYFYTKDLSRAFRIAEALEFGMVGINDALISAPQAPFGGIKESGFGREGGHHGLTEYLNLKYVSLSI